MGLQDHRPQTTRLPDLQPSPSSFTESPSMLKLRRDKSARRKATAWQANFRSAQGRIRLATASPSGGGRGEPPTSQRFNALTFQRFNVSPTHVRHLRPV